MENRIAVVAVIVEQAESVEKVNAQFHEYRKYIVGRFGLPLHDKGISVINVVLDAPQDVISGLSGKLGMINGVCSKVLTAK